MSPAGLPWLVGDIGGTNARFGWVDDPAAGVRHVAQQSTAGSEHLAGAVRRYLASLPPGTPPPRRAAVAVATPVLGDEVRLTNTNWRFSRRDSSAELGLERLLVLNDFEALAMSLPRLRPAQLRPIGDRLPPAEGPLAVIGPGTGLGVGGVLPTAHGWVAVAGEGGHATLAPGDDFESALLQQVRASHGHVSGERLLAGVGLPTLHQAVAAVRGQAAPALDTAAVVARGLAGEDPLCVQALDSFCALLGGMAGNLALTLGARGGVYVGGGIVPRLGEYFFRSRFRERFEAKGRFRDYLAAVPTALITDTLAALDGAALALEQLD